MAKRISIINFKGGVGKTTLAFHLGTGLAKFHDKKKFCLLTWIIKVVCQFSASAPDIGSRLLRKNELLMRSSSNSLVEHLHYLVLKSL